MELQGLHAYDAAVYCASLSAARRANSGRGEDGRRRSTGSSAVSERSSVLGRSRSLSCTGSAGDASSSSSTVGSSSDDSVEPVGSNSSNSSGSEDGGSDRGAVVDLARRSWAPGSYSGSVGSSAFGKFCLLQAAATHLLTSLRLLWQAPDDLDAFC
jgi:hypothetical protein